jgi:phosphoglycolate phosphatase-like HAD superfamily hydrolase
MRRRALLALPLLFTWSAFGEPATLSDAIETLGQERSYAESGAAMLKAYSDGDIDGRRLYAQAKAEFDGLIEKLLADLAQNQDPTVSPAFQQRLDAAVTKRVAFSEYVDKIIKANVPENAKPGLIDALAKTVPDVIKELFASGVAIWHEWRTASKERREQIANRLEAQRWKPFADIPKAT